MTKSWFITGVSTGLGRALAVRALDRGDAVAGTVRQKKDMAPFEALAPGRALAFQLDVTDRNRVFEVVKDAWTALGRIDVVVNNAGYGSIGAVEEVSEEEFRRQFDVNVFGALSVTQSALPFFRNQGGGHFLQVSSVGGFVSFPGVGIYNASKYALEGFSEALAREAAHHGVRVTIVEPGAFRTDWAGRSLNVTEPSEAYEQTVGERVRGLEALDGQQVGDPLRAADRMLEVVASAHPPLRLVLGADALAAIEQKLGHVAAELEAWRESSTRTRFHSPSGSS